MSTALGTIKSVTMEQDDQISTNVNVGVYLARTPERFLILLVMAAKGYDGLQVNTPGLKFLQQHVLPHARLVCISKVQGYQFPRLGKGG